LPDPSIAGCPVYDFCQGDKCGSGASLYCCDDPNFTFCCPNGQCGSGPTSCGDAGTPLEGGPEAGADGSSDSSAGGGPWCCCQSDDLCADHDAFCDCDQVAPGTDCTSFCIMLAPSISGLQVVSNCSWIAAKNCWQGPASAALNGYPEPACDCLDVTECVSCANSMGVSTSTCTMPQQGGTSVSQCPPPLRFDAAQQPQTLAVLPFTDVPGLHVGEAFVLEQV
ncbi:MAG: hypothetical protein ACRELB_03135, partial [Polyangiaceae bacterium]